MASYNFSCRKIGFQNLICDKIETYIGFNFICERIISPPERRLDIGLLHLVDVQRHYLLQGRPDQCGTAPHWVLVRQGEDVVGGEVQVTHQVETLGLYDGHHQETQQVLF